MNRGYPCLWTKVCPDNQSDGVFLVEATAGLKNPSFVIGQLSMVIFLNDKWQLTND
jgi:hypothetical protein